MLRLRLGPASALEIADEGPPVFGARRPDRALPLDPETDAGAWRSSSPRAVTSAARSSRRCGSLDRDPLRRGRDLRGGRRGGGLERARDPRQPVRDRPRSRRDGARQGHVQQPRPARERAGDGRAAPGGARARGGGDRCLTRRGGGSERLGRALDSLAGDTSRRGFLARVGGALTALTAGGLVGQGDQARRGRGLPLLRPHLHHRLLPPPDRGLPRIDRHGYPLRRRATGSRSTTSAARSTTAASRSSTDGKALRDPDGRPLPPAPRTKVCERDGAELRLRAPRRRRLVPLLRRPRAQARRLLLATSDKRINGDQALEGYCYAGPQGVLRHVLPDQGALLSGALEITLAAAALLAGLTGTWSPCGFSMIETIGPVGHTRRAGDDDLGLRDVHARRAGRRRG